MQDVEFLKAFYPCLRYCLIFQVVTSAHADSTYDLIINNERVSATKYY